MIVHLTGPLSRPAAFRRSLLSTPSARDKAKKNSRKQHHHRKMNLPPSALLGRLQAFLPEMEKANKATERLLADGKLDVIDANLQVATGHQRGDESAEETDNEEVEGEVGEEDAEEEEDEDGPETGGAAGADSRTVELVRVGMVVRLLTI